MSKPQARQEPHKIPVVIQALIDTVFYEGCVPDRCRASPSADRQRPTLGGLFPRAYTAVRGGEACRMQVQCLLAGAHPPLTLRLRFLQVVTRQAGRAVGRERPLRWRPVPVLDVDGRRYVSWDEALEREVVVEIRDLQALTAQPRRERFRFDAAQEMEYLRDARDCTVGVLMRRREALAGALQVSAELAGEELHRITVQIVNDTPLAHANAVPHVAAQRHAFSSIHVLLSAPAAHFISMTDPPAPKVAAVKACRNEGDGDDGRCVMSRREVIGTRVAVPTGELPNRRDIVKLIELRRMPAGRRH